MNGPGNTFLIVATLIVALYLIAVERLTRNIGECFPCGCSGNRYTRKDGTCSKCGRVVVGSAVAKW